MIIAGKGTAAGSTADLVSASTSDQKLSVELLLPKQIYTTGSTVAGVVHLGNKNRENINEVSAAIICTSIVTTADMRTTSAGKVPGFWKLCRLCGRVTRGMPAFPAEMPFQLIMPEYGNDKRADNASAPLPPSFHGGRHHGWSNVFTYGHPIGFVKYQVKVKVLHDRRFMNKAKAYAPFIFLPSSPPPPLLPSVPDMLTSESQLGEEWVAEHANTTLRQSLFNNKGEASVKLWLPRLDSYPRATSMPLFLCLTMQTRHVASTSETEPSSSIIPPSPLKAKLHLQRKIRVCAKKGVQRHTQTFDKSPADNLVHGCVPWESIWMRKIADVGGHVFWEKMYVWQGVWTFRETVNFENRQLHWKYHLVGEIAIKGLTNGVRLVSNELNISSGVTSGQSFVPVEMEGDDLELPPDYFEIEGDNDDEDEGDNDRPPGKE